MAGLTRFTCSFSSPANKKMMSKLTFLNVGHSQVSWSVQKIKLLAQCRKRYRLRYLLKNGWKSDSCDEAREAYRLNLLQTEASYSGVLIHKRIRRMLAGEISGFRYNLESEADAAAREFALAVAQGEVLRTQDIRKGKIKFLCQHLGEAINSASIAKWQEMIRESLQTWSKTQTVAELIDTPSRIIPRFLDPNEPLFSEALGAPAWIKTDVVATRDDGILIVDWKTGRIGNCDQDQAAIYDYILRDEMELNPEADVTVRFVYLSDGSAQNFEFDEDDRSQLRWRVAEEMGEILEAEMDPSASAFRARAGWQCQHCPFQSMCDEGSRFNATRSAMGRCA